MDERERRLGLNEALFRQVNEAVSDISDDFDAADFEIVCECGDLGCSDRIQITNAAYAALRSESHQFALVPGHEIPDVETVIADEGAYYVVRKDSPAARELAERTDTTKPR
jgi:hypothetical protein